MLIELILIHGGRILIPKKSIVNIQESYNYTYTSSTTNPEKTLQTIMTLKDMYSSLDVLNSYEQSEEYSALRILQHTGYEQIIVKENYDVLKFTLQIKKPKDSYDK